MKRLTWFEGNHEMAPPRDRRDTASQVCLRIIPRVAGGKLFSDSTLSRNRCMTMPKAQSRQRDEK